MPHETLFICICPDSLIQTQSEALMSGAIRIITIAQKSFEKNPTVEKFKDLVYNFVSIFAPKDGLQYQTIPWKNGDTLSLTKGNDIDEIIVFNTTETDIPLTYMEANTPNENIKAYSSWWD